MLQKLNSVTKKERMQQVTAISTMLFEIEKGLAALHPDCAAPLFVRIPHFREGLANYGHES